MKKNWWTDYKAYLKEAKELEIAYNADLAGLAEKHEAGVKVAAAIAIAIISLIYGAYALYAFLIIRREKKEQVDEE